MFRRDGYAVLNRPSPRSDSIDGGDSLESGSQVTDDNVSLEDREPDAGTGTSTSGKPFDVVIVDEGAPDVLKLQSVVRRSV